jgi:hypothetical protein
MNFNIPLYDTLLYGTPKTIFDLGINTTLSSSGEKGKNYEFLWNRVVSTYYWYVLTHHDDDDNGPNNGRRPSYEQNNTLATSCPSTATEAAAAVSRSSADPSRWWSMMV